MSLSLKSKNYFKILKAKHLPTVSTLGSDAPYYKADKYYSATNVQTNHDEQVPYIEGFDSNAEGRVAYWLIDNGWFSSIEELLNYSQVYVAGGRNSVGGHVLDFVMPSDYYPPTLITVTGTYWHGLDEVEERDAELALWALANNMRIVEVPEAITLDAIQFQAYMEEQIGIRY